MFVDRDQSAAAMKLNLSPVISFSSEAKKAEALLQ